MAQTKRKRQTKHRGNAAGVVESRGRTGRKPTAAEKSGKAGEAARAKQQRVAKADQPPTWRGAALRALIAAAALVLLSGIILKASAGQSIIYFFLGLIFYTPISYYSDGWLYRRRQAKKAAGKPGSGKASPR
jgi:hypothetical protein